MKRVPAKTWLALLGMWGASAHADESLWGPSRGVTPKVESPAVVVPVPAPLIEIQKVEPPKARPESDAVQWLPARRYPTDYPPKPALMNPSPKAPSLPVPPGAIINPSPFKEPVDAGTPRALAPAIFPPIQTPTITTSPFTVPNAIEEPKPLPLEKLPEPITKLVDPPKIPMIEDKPAVPKPKPKAESSETLPLPRTEAVTIPALPVSVPVPVAGAAVQPTYTVHLTEQTGADPLAQPVGQQPELLQSSGRGVPIRNKVFGTPSLNLSRDYHFRDVLGLDLMMPGSGVAGEVGGTQDVFFVNAELLLWWQNRARIPALATTSTSTTGSGFLGDPQTRTLLGPGEFGPSFLQGFRLRAGGYVDECGTVGLDGGFFFIGPGREKRTFDSGTNPVITRPFFAPNFNSEFGEVVARPGLSTGRLEVEQSSNLWGIDINLRRAFCRDCTGGRGWFLGYRHLNLAESLSITEFITASGNQTTDPVGTRVLVNDTFRTHNRFHGPQLGWWWNRREGILDYDLRASVALGATNQMLTISGFQQRTRPGEATQNFNGGLLATGPNLGEFNQTSFSVVPEVTFNVGVFVLPNLRLYAGYNFLFWGNVVRPGDQIDRVVDVTLVPNPPAGAVSSGQNRPLPTFTQSNYWAQGIQLGAELRW